MIANARMYSATAGLRADWRAVLEWVLARAGLDWPVLDHDAPAPLAALWAREDLGLVMMCGLPYRQRPVRPTLVAAPVPAPARYGGRPVYFTDVVVRADARFERIEQTFGGTVGYTLADSWSGGVAFRHHLVVHDAHYARAVGGLIHARGVIEALHDGRIDVGPLDSYYHDLLRQAEPALAAQVRVIDRTGPMPIPPLVATAPLSEAILVRLREALLAVATEPALAPQRARLLLTGFAIPAPSDYDPLDRIARQPEPAFEDL